MPKSTPRAMVHPPAPDRTSWCIRHWPLAALVLLYLIFYHRLLFGVNYLWEDIVEQVYPNLRFCVYCLKRGWLPMWTPYVFSGMPFLADPISTLFYPPQWLLYLASMVTEPGGLSFAWYQTLHMLVLGVGAYFLGLDCQFEKRAAFFLAVAAMFTGYVSLHIIHANFMYVVAWTPWIFLFVQRACRSGSAGDWAIAAALLGVSTLGGYPQYTMHLAYFFFAWTACTALRQATVDRKALLRLGVAFAAFIAVGIGLAAIQYLPSTEMMAQSVREELTFKDAAIGSIPFSRLLSFFAPKFYGSVTGMPGAGAPYWGFENKTYLFWETNAFASIAVIFLALRALLEIRRNRRVLFFAVCGAACLILAMGDNTPLYGLVFRLLPGFGRFRIPGRFTLWLSFCLIMLAAMGLDMLLKEDRPKDRRFLIAAGALAGVITLGGLAFFGGMLQPATEFFKYDVIVKNSRQAVGIMIFTAVTVFGLIAVMIVWGWRRSMAYGLTAVAFCELFAFGHDFGCSPQNPRDYYERFDLRWLRAELAQESFRVQSRLYKGPGRGELLLPRNLGNVQRIPLTEGYNQLMLKRYNDFLYKVNDSVGVPLLTIRYRKIPAQPRLERRPAFPRFYLASRYAVFDNQDDLIGYMNSPDFVPGRHVALEQRPAILPDTVLGDSGSVRLISETPNRIELEVQARGNTILNTADVYYPAWTAAIDGKPAQLLAANLLFRSVPVPAGSHRVVISYRSKRFYQGALVSGVMLACVIGTLAVSRRRRVPAIPAERPSAT